MYQIKNRLVIARIYVALSIFFSVMIAMFEKTSVSYMAIKLTEAPPIFMYSALVLCLVALVDVIVNDFAPDKYKFEWALNYRHLVYMGLAVLAFSLSAGVITAFGTTLFLCRLWLDGIVATLVAFLDILGRRGYSGSKIYIQPN